MYANSRLRREISRYLQGLRDEGLTTRYIAQHKASLLSFLEHCEGRGIRAVKTVDAEAALSFLEGWKSYSGSYQEKHWCVLRRFLVASGNTALVRVRPKIHGTARTRVDWLTLEESQAVLETQMTQEQELLICSGLLQGLRRVETLRMTVRDAKDALRTGTLRVRGKGGKERAIPTHDLFVPVLQNYLTWLEPETDDRRMLDMGRTATDERLVEFCGRHGRKFTFHTLRRSFGRNLWLHGVPVETISELLGHASTDMTRKYLGLNLTDIRKAMSCYAIARTCTSSGKLDR